MHPILFQFGALKIYSYGLMVAIAFIVATYLAKLEASREDIDPQKILDLSICLVISGVIGGRILYVLQNLSYYFRYPYQIFMLNRGGLSFYGGFGLAVISAIIFLKREDLPASKILDIIAPYLALGQSIGRIGCFLNGCCYGKPTNFFFAVYFPEEFLARHPTQLYASLNLLLIFIILRVFRGPIFLLYCLLYSGSRFFIEYLRGDNLPVFATFTIHQLISVGIFIVSGIFLWKRLRSSTSRL